MTVAGARETVGSPVVQQNGIQCFNCKGFGHYPKECRKPKRVKDYTYHKEKMMMCKQAEHGVPLQAEQADWLEDTDEEIDEQELEAHYSFMAKIQEVLPEESSSTDQPLEQNVLTALANLIANLTLDTEENKTILKQLKKANASLTQELEECKTNLDETSRALGEATSCRDSCLIALQNKQNEFEKYKAFNDRTIDYEILQTKLNDTLGLLALKDIEIKEGLKTKAYEISVLNQKHDELVKKSLLTKSQLEGYLKEKTKVISDLKVKEEKDIDKMIEMDKQLKFLNEIVYTRNQSIQTIHMLAPKCSTYNGRPTFANPRYLKKAQSEKPCLYEIPYDTSDLANRFAPNREETMTLANESRSKLNKDYVKPYDYTKHNTGSTNIKNGTQRSESTKGKDGVSGFFIQHTQAGKTVQFAEEKERKARTLLLMAIPKDHLRRFHGMDDAKEIWAAIKTRFGGNANSKKMQKAVLKQQFEAFTISSKESLEKGYDRFQKLLSQLDALGAGVSDEDANHKFLRSLPPAWDSLAMTMRTKKNIDTLSIDDLYNNLSVFEQDIQKTSSSSLASDNVAFLSQAKASSSKHKPSHSSGSYSSYTTSSSKATPTATPGLADEVIHSFLANNADDMDWMGLRIKQQKIVSWRYYDTSRVHCLNLESMDVYLLSDKKYPLSAEMAQSSLRNKTRLLISKKKAFAIITPLLEHHEQAALSKDESATLPRILKDKSASDYDNSDPTPKTKFVPIAENTDSTQQGVELSLQAFT
ncbi:integrase, catalytic region, zinc finger, CCHC-type containing protein [Tanacetum coccineum]